LDEFYRDAKAYYGEAAKAIIQYTPVQFAYLLLACNVRLSSGNGQVPGTDLKWDDLVEKSIVFPYYLSKNKACKHTEVQSYYFPPLFWIDLAVPDLIFSILLTLL